MRGKSAATVARRPSAVEHLPFDPGTRPRAGGIEEFCRELVRCSGAARALSEMASDALVFCALEGLEYVAGQQGNGVPLGCCLHGLDISSWLPQSGGAKKQ